jgi:hypothetical protein
MLDGFYVGYMSSVGYGVALFVFRDGHIVGVDAGGVKFDGTYKFDEAQNSYLGHVTIDIPPNTTVIQGQTMGTQGLKYTTNLALPANFLAEPFFQVSTPLGTVNVKMEKLRDLGDKA